MKLAIIVRFVASLLVAALAVQAAERRVDTLLGVPGGARRDAPVGGSLVDDECNLNWLKKSSEWKMTTERNELVLIYIGPDWCESCAEVLEIWCELTKFVSKSVRSPVFVGAIDVEHTSSALLREPALSNLVHYPTIRFVSGNGTLWTDWERPVDLATLREVTTFGLRHFTPEPLETWERVAMAAIESQSLIGIFPKREKNNAPLDKAAYRASKQSRAIFKRVAFRLRGRVPDATRFAVVSDVRLAVPLMHQSGGSSGDVVCMIKGLGTVQALTWPYTEAQLERFVVMFGFGLISTWSPEVRDYRCSYDSQLHWHSRLDPTRSRSTETLLARVAEQLPVSSWAERASVAFPAHVGLDPLPCVCLVEPPVSPETNSLRAQFLRLAQKFGHRLPFVYVPANLTSSAFGTAYPEFRLSQAAHERTSRDRWPWDGRLTILYRSYFHAPIEVPFVGQMAASEGMLTESDERDLLASIDRFVRGFAFEGRSLVASRVGGLVVPPASPSSQPSDGDGALIVARVRPHEFESLVVEKSVHCAVVVLYDDSSWNECGGARGARLCAAVRATFARLATDFRQAQQEGRVRFVRIDLAEGLGGVFRFDGKLWPWPKPPEVDVWHSGRPVYQRLLLSRVEGDTLADSIHDALMTLE